MLSFLNPFLKSHVWSQFCAYRWTKVLATGQLSLIIYFLFSAYVYIQLNKDGWLAILFGFNLKLNQVILVQIFYQIKIQEYELWPSQ